MQKKFHDRYKNLSEKQRQKLLEYMRKYYLAHKKQLIFHFKDPKAIRIVLRINT